MQHDDISIDIGKQVSEFIVGSYCHWRMFLYRVHSSYQRLINL